MSPYPEKGECKRGERRKKMKNRMLAAFAALMISLAVVGFSYAQWTTTITVNGYAKFGTVSLIWSKYQFESETSPTGKFSAEITDGGKNVNVGFDNAYPGYKVFFWLETTNTGSLPVRYYNFKCTSTNDAALDSHFTLTFYDPAKNPNIWATFAGWKGTTHVYDDWGVPQSAVTFVAGETHWSLVSISIDGDVGIEYAGLTYTATFEMTGVLAV
jgi:hypothetical protein